MVCVRNETRPKTSAQNGCGETAVAGYSGFKLRGGPQNLTVIIEGQLTIKELAILSPGGMTTTKNFKGWSFPWKWPCRFWLCIWP